MKTRVILIVLSAVLAVYLVPRAAAAESLTVNLTFDAANLQIGTKTGCDGVTYSSVSLAGCYESTEDAGKPELPAKTVRILLPPGASLESVVAAPKGQEVYPTPQWVHPKQPPVPVFIDDQPPPCVSPDPVAYASSAPYPGERILWRRAFDHIGNFVCAAVTVYPVDYTPAAGQLTLYTSIDITLNYTPAANYPLPVVRRSAQAEHDMESFIAAVVENPEMLSSYPRPLADEQIVDFVIIAPPEPGPVVPEWQRLADWKTARGVRTRVVYTDWIAANFSGVDLAERIRNFIKHAYANWGTIYVLLAGDTSLIPDRKAHNAIWEWGPTDLYYAGLSGNWNANGNSQFGESDDQCDDTPDVFLGRAPIRTSSQAKNFVDKVLTYEQSPPIGPSDPPYLTSALLMGANVGGEWGQWVKNTIRSQYIPSDWYAWKLYNVLDGGDELLRRTAAVQHLSLGYHFANHADHSSPYVMGTGVEHPVSWDERVMTRRDVDGLTNGKRQSIVFSLGCSPNAFDVDSISEHFINNGSGAVAYIGNTRVGYTSQAYQDFKFFESLFDDGLYNLGAAFASILYIPPFDTRSMNLLGDPEMPVWTSSPKEMLVVVPENIGLRPTDVTVYVLERTLMPPFPPLPDALVCLWKGDEVYARGWTDQEGKVTLNVVPESPGNILVTAAKHNFLPGRETLPVVQTTDPALSYSNHRVDDDTTPPSNGNGNGIVDAGETIQMPVEIKNKGGGHATLVEARLWTDSPYITILDDTEQYPDIPPEGTAWSLEDFDFSVSLDTPDQTVVRFQLNITAYGAPGELHWKDHFDVVVHAPVLSHALHRVDDGPGGNGILDPSETAYIPLAIRNSGSGQSADVEAWLESLSPNIVILGGYSYFHGPILPRSEQWNCPWTVFRIQTTQDYQPGDRVRLTGRDVLFGHTFTHEFDFTPIAAPTNLRLTPGQGSMDLAWDPVLGALGYHVYRKSPSGDIVRLNDELITTGSLFHESGLSASTAFNYLITAVNESRNESVDRLEGLEFTNPALMGGWPQEIGSNAVDTSSAAVGDIDGDGSNEIIIGATDMRVYAWKSDGSLVYGWPKTMPVEVTASPALANLDGDAALEIVLPVGDKVYVWNGDGTALPGWPQTMAGSTPNSASIGDIDRDSRPEIVASSLSPPYIYAWNEDGTLVSGWPTAIMQPEDWVRTEAALADVDADGYPEVIVGTLDTAYQESWVYVFNHDGSIAPFWPQPVDFVIWAAPVVADIDDDDRAEIIVGNMRDRIYAWHGDATPQEGNWPRYVGSSVANAPALANLDGGNDIEIIAGLGNGQVIALKHDGTALTGWPVQAEANNRSMDSPAVADLDSDGQQEIAAPCSAYNGLLHMLRVDGSRFRGSPYATGGGMPVAPTIAELHPFQPGDGTAEIIISGLDRLVYNWTLPGPYNPQTAEWPTFMHDMRRTGSYGPDNTGQPVAIDRIGTLKFYPDGAWVRLSGKIVTAGTAEFVGQIYIEEVDRSSGIRVEVGSSPPQAYQRWMVVQVVGRLATVDGERVLVDATVDAGMLSIVVDPVGMNNKSLGGGRVGRFTLGVYPDGYGANNTGLLARTWGYVTYVSPLGDYFYIDDGSGLNDSSGHIGVRVDLKGHPDTNVIAPPPARSYVAVTGMSSCAYAAPVEQPVRVLRPRDQADIQIIRY